MSPSLIFLNYRCPACGNTDASCQTESDVLSGRVGSLRVPQRPSDPGPDMPEDEPDFDGKLLTSPAVLLHKLDIDTSPAPASAPAPAPAPAQPRVLMHKLDIELPIDLPSSSDEGPAASVDNNSAPDPDDAASISEPLRGFTRMPIVVLARCKIPDKIKKPQKKVCFNVPEVNLDRYTLVGPYRDNIVIKRCRVKVARDDLRKLKSLIARTNDEATPCNLCGKVYWSRKKLNYHLERKHDLVIATGHKKKRVSFSNEVIVHKMQYHRCRKCLKVFETYKILKAHMKSEHKKRNCYVCDYCQKLFADRVIFKLHIKLHCVKCSKLFLIKSDLVQHRKRECYIKQVNKKTCNTCNETYFSNLALMDHSFSHLEKKKIICDFCKEHFSSKCPLLQHLDSHSPSSNVTNNFTVVNAGLDKVYTCTFCSEAFIGERDIQKHLEYEKPVDIRPSVHQCEYCPKKFKIAKNLSQHMWAHLHNTLDNNARTRKPHTLPSQDPSHLSGELNKKKNMILENGKDARMDRMDLEGDDDCYIVEEQKEMENESLTSPKAGKRASNRMKLLQFKCEKCNKRYSQKSSLNRHMKLHEDYENLRCHVCEETFAWPSLVRDHKCIMDKSIPELPFDDIRPDIQVIQPVVNPETSFSLMDEDLPATNDITNQIDFEIPAPIFEFANIGGGMFPQENVYGITNTFNRFHTKYKVVRQEVPIEF